MRVIILQHISIEDPGYIKDLMIKDGVELTTIELDEGQKRIMSPKEAFKNGCDWLVIGRPITKGNIKKNIQTLIQHLN